MVFSSVTYVPWFVFRVPHWRRPQSRRPSWLHYRKAMCNLYECFESVGNELLGLLHEMLLGLLHEMLPNTALNLQQFWQQSPKCIICCKNQLLNWQRFCNSTSRVGNHTHLCNTKTQASMRLYFQSNRYCIPVIRRLKC